MNYEERRKIMAEQRNAWLEQQVQERKAAENERRQAEAAYMVWLYFPYTHKYTLFLHIALITYLISYN